MNDILFINDGLLDSLFAKASQSNRLRMNFDLRTSPADRSQRMLNALMPGTVVPIHRHRETDETVIVLKGSLTEIFFNENGHEVGRFNLSPKTGYYGLQIPSGIWHTVIANEPTVIFESKDGAFFPINPEDVLER